MAVPGEDVYCTLLMSDTYLPGAVVLAHSLRDSGTTKKLAILVTLDSILHSTVEALKNLYDFIITVDKIANPNLENLARLDRLDLRFAFTKIVLWRQLQFRKIVYVDSDVVALRAPDELFDIDAPFAAAPDIGWPDIFNSGVMVLKPNMSEYWSLQTLSSSGESFDGADQGLLNQYFGSKRWHRLSFVYNCTPSASYQYEPAYRYFRSTINMVHFIGKDKPWQQGRSALSSSSSGVYKELLGRWWAVYDRHYRDQPSPVSGKYQGTSRAVQQYVKDEEAGHSFDWASNGYPSREEKQEHNASRNDQPQTDLHSVHQEQPMTDPGEVVEDIDRGLIQPHPTAEQRRFSTSYYMDWDATRSEPPAQSKPEAENFPTARYEMSSDRSLFKAPTSYPEPPPEVKNQLPAMKPAVKEKPKAVFPWEEKSGLPKATRVFAEDEGKEVDTMDKTTTALSSLTTKDDLTEEAETAIPATPPTPTIKVSSADPWESFNRSNAWDAMPSIDKYVRALKASQSRRGPVQVVHSAESTTSGTASGSQSPKRRESLILTDFPTEIERPSLPVTPAPMARPTFWGDERNDQGELPAAEGVPEQAEWVCPRCRCRFHLPPKLVASVVKVVVDPKSCSDVVMKPLKSSPGSRRSSGSTEACGAEPLDRCSCNANESSSHKNPTAQLEQLRRSSLIRAEELPDFSNMEMPSREMPSTSTFVMSSFSHSGKPLVQSTAASTEESQSMTETATQSMTEMTTQSTTETTIQSMSESWTSQSGSSSHMESFETQGSVTPTAASTFSMPGFSSTTYGRREGDGEMSPTTE